MLKAVKIFLFFLFASTLGFAQTNNYGFPYIKNYTPKDYIGSNQNWSIVQDKSGIIYFGNSPSIIALHGNSIKWIPSLNSSVVRSMDIDTINNIIYVGVQDDFGYLSVNKKGKHEFV